MAQNLKDLIEKKCSSDEIDKILRLRVFETEKILLEKHGHFKQYNYPLKHETWIGLEPETLQTPYYEILEALSLLEKYSINTYIDLGAGYGRLAFTLYALNRDFNFIGYELVNERVDEGNRVIKELKLHQAKLHCQNILAEDFNIPMADLYLIYDFSTPKDQKNLLDQFSKRMYKDNFFLLARGKGIRSLIQNEYPEFYNCNGVIHLQNISIYSSFTELT